MLAKRDASHAAKRDASHAARQDASLAARHDASLAARHDASLAARQDASLAVRQDASLAARHDAFLAARHDASLAARSHQDSRRIVRQEARRDSSRERRRDSHFDSSARIKGKWPIGTLSMSSQNHSYMFVAHNSYQCHFLIPKDNATWTDDEDDDDDDDDDEYQTLKDKGGRYRALIPCAERLVVSVRMQSQASRLESPADKQLFKTLDSSFVVTNTISDYFPSSQKQCIDSEPTSLQLRYNGRKKMKNMTKSQQKPRVLPPDSDQNKRLHKKSIFDSSSEELTDDGDELVLKQRGQVQAPLCSGRDSVYQAFREKDIDVSIDCDSPSIMNEWIRTRRKSGSNDSLEDTNTEIPSLSDELQVSYNNTQSFIGDATKAEKSYLGDITMDSAKSEKIDVVDSTNENEFSSCQNFSDEYEIPLSYSPGNEQLSCKFDNEEFGCNYSSIYQTEIGEIHVDNEIGEDNTSFLCNKEDDSERYMLCHKNTRLNDDSLEAKHFGLAQEKSSSVLNMSSITLDRKSQLCETADSTLTKTTLSSQFLFSSEDVNELNGQNKSKAQNLKKEDAVNLKLADQEKDEVSFGSKNKSESVSIDPQNVVGWCKKKPCSNSDISEGVGNDLGHCSKIEEEITVKMCPKGSVENL
ncbi:uncharacterized protein [Macrobrachium rosenbergii]|uniref:uncharacterized protein n=1 Tax=Macrobrachium rosenbergii TaxID=79674 RepID=UPI0034D73DF0